MKNAPSSIAIALFLILLFFQTKSVFSQALQGDYTIQTQEIKQQTRRTPESSVNTAQNVLRGQNYEAVLGFGDSNSNDFFSIQISTGLVDFGKLYPTNPILRDTEITINPASSNKYAVLVSQDHSLSDTGFANLIPDTSCDRGLCSITVPSTWTENLTYGFGYSCQNILNLPCSGFEEESFKRFPDQSKGDPHEVIMKGYNTDAKAKIIYKLNVPPTQVNSIYSNTIDLIALPGI